MFSIFIFLPWPHRHKHSSNVAKGLEVSPSKPKQKLAKKSGCLRDSRLKFSSAKFLCFTKLGPEVTANLNRISVLWSLVLNVINCKFCKFCFAVIFLEQKYFGRLSTAANSLYLEQSLSRRTCPYFEQIFGSLYPSFISNCIYLKFSVCYEFKSSSLYIFNSASVILRFLYAPFNLRNKYFVYI